jgi:hypothetical protein
MVLTRAYPITLIAPGPLSRLALAHGNNAVSNSKANPIQTRFVSHDTDSIG